MKESKYMYSLQYNGKEELFKTPELMNERCKELLGKNSETIYKLEQLEFCGDCIIHHSMN